MNSKPETRLPPDRSLLLTEQRNPRSYNLHKMSVCECVEFIHNEDSSIFKAISKAQPQIVSFIEDAESHFNRGGRLIYIGAGTSGRLGVLDASECPPTFQVPPERVVGIIAGGDRALRKSSEGMEDDPDGAREILEQMHLTADDILLGIASGGTTPYVRGAFTIAKRIQPGVLTGFLVCTSVPKPPDADHLVLIETGEEILTGSTRMKAGSATKMVLNTISTTLMVRAGRIYQNLMVDLRATNDKLRDRAARIISAITELNRLESFTLLEEAGGVVKVAILMHLASLSREDAERKLELSGGYLDRVLNGEY